MSLIFPTTKRKQPASLNRNLAVIVHTEAKLVNGTRTRAMAQEFYREIEEHLKTAGYEVIHDAGRPFTHPDRNAGVMVVHDKGAGRMRHASPWATVLMLETNLDADSVQTGTNLSLMFQLSEQDKKDLDDLCEMLNAAV